MPEPLYDLSGKRVWVAGDRGMVGSAITHRLSSEPCQLIRASRAAVDLTRQEQVEAWMATARPEAVFVAAAKVGGIHANDPHRSAEHRVGTVGVRTTNSRWAQSHSKQQT